MPQSVVAVKALCVLKCNVTSTTFTAYINFVLSGLQANVFQDVNMVENATNTGCTIPCEETEHSLHNTV